MGFVAIPPSDKLMDYDEEFYHQTEDSPEIREFQEFLGGFNDFVDAIDDCMKNHSMHGCKSGQDMTFAISDKLPNFTLSIRYTHSKKDWDNNAKCSDDHVERNSIKILYYLSLANSHKGVLIAKKFFYYECDFWDNLLSTEDSKIYWVRKDMLLNVIFLLYQEFLGK